LMSENYNSFKLIMSDDQSDDHEYYPVSLHGEQKILFWSSIGATIAIYVLTVVFGLVNTVKYIIRQQRYV